MYYCTQAVTRTLIPISLYKLFRYQRLQRSNVELVAVVQTPCFGIFIIFGRSLAYLVNLLPDFSLVVSFPCRNCGRSAAGPSRDGDHGGGILLGRQRGVRFNVGSSTCFANMLNQCFVLEFARAGTSTPAPPPTA